MNKKIISVLLALALLLCAGCAKKGVESGTEAQGVITDSAGTQQSGGSQGGGQMQIPNPFTEYGSLEEAEAAAGFKMHVPAIIEGATEYVWRVMDAGDTKMIEAIYYAGDEEMLRIRKAEGTEPVDGDYTQYPMGAMADYPFAAVEMRGDDDGAKVITWTQNMDGKDYSFAITSPRGLSMTSGEADKLICFLAEYGTKETDSTMPVQTGTVTDPAGAIIDDFGGIDGSGSEAAPQYSPRTVIVSVEEGFSKEQLDALLSKYDLEVLYDYEALNMYALNAGHDMDEPELSALIKELSAEDGVLFAEPDQIITLDDPVAEITTAD